jgi:ElaB/YqjD/DUF883 family membrane-anchored ribosome-binding protein
MSIGNSETDQVSETGQATDMDQDLRDATASAADEATYLDDAAEAAKQAVADNVERLKTSLSEAVDPIEWMREHPWMSLGLGLALGFTAGAVINPLGEKSPVDEARADTQPATPPPHRPARASLGASALNMIFEPLFEMAKVALTSMLVAAVKRYSEPPPETTDDPDIRSTDAAA